MSEQAKQCPQCKQTSGNDWSQCPKGQCPMPMSPHWNERVWIKFTSGTGALHIDGVAVSDTPIAPVASHDLVRELVEALETVQTHLYFRAEHIGRCTGDKNCSCGLELAKSEVVLALAKAKLAGLDVPHE